MTEPGKAPIDFYFDFSSPYGYLMAEKIDAIAAQHGRKVKWHPILLGVIFQATGSRPPADGGASRMAGARNPVDKVYAFTNFEQGSVFASAPRRVGRHSIDKTYSPLWEMITVTWRTGVAPRTLTSEEQVLDAQEKDQVTLGHTRVVVNCPIVQMGDTERLFGAVLK